MNRYLFRITTKKSDGWSNAIPKPIYLVARDKDEVEVWAKDGLRKGVSVARIICLAEQVANDIFVSRN